MKASRLRKTCKKLAMVCVEDGLKKSIELIIVGIIIGASIKLFILIVPTVILSTLVTHIVKTVLFRK